MAAVPPPLPQRDWAQRNRLWFLPLLVVLGLSLFVGIFVGMFSMIRGQMTSHPAYIEAMTRARGNADVAAALGKPIEPGMFVMGTVSNDDDGGHAYITVPLIGPKAEAKLSVMAFRDDEAWAYTTMTVDLTDGREISLLTPDESAPPVASDLPGAPRCDRPAADTDEA